MGAIGAPGDIVGIGAGKVGGATASAGGTYGPNSRLMLGATLSSIGFGTDKGKVRGSGSIGANASTPGAVAGTVTAVAAGLGAGITNAVTGWTTVLDKIGKAGKASGIANLSGSPGDASGMVRTEGCRG